MSANRKARRRMDRAMRKMERKGMRAYFRVEMSKDGRIAESAHVDPQDARAMLQSIRELLASLEAQVEQRQAADAALAQRAAQAFAGQPRAGAAALKHFAPEEDA